MRQATAGSYPETTLINGTGQVRDRAAISTSFPWANLFVLCVLCEIGFYFIAKSSPLPVGQGEGRLSYGVLINALKGERRIVSLMPPFLS